MKQVTDSSLAINGGKPVREQMLGYGHQLIDDADIAAVEEILRSDYLTCGPTTELFEEALCGVTGAKYCTAVSNGTAALHVACLSAGIKPGDEVIVSPITFAASANCVLYCGGTPVFADIKPDTWNIDPASIEERVTDKTKAVVAVDFGGCPVDHKAIREICDKHGLTFIEDAAHAIGTSDEMGTIGSIADITCFSFHPVKTITTCEGGAVMTNSDHLGTTVELYAKHGITRRPELLLNDEGGWYYEELVLGYNYRINDVEAALGISQLKKLDEFSARRRELVAYYNEQFKDVPHVSFQVDSTPEKTTRHLYCLRFDVDALGVDRKWIYDALRAEGLGVNVHYQPVYHLPYYREHGFENVALPEAEAYYRQAVTIPLHCAMSDADARDVVAAVKKVLAAAERA